jgi:hypothetical protein
MTVSLPEELQLEILKRLLPSPQVLARASAVCREWRRVVNDRGFLRELYRGRRGAPVTLGFFHNSDDLSRRDRFVHMNAGGPLRIAFDPIDQKTDLYFLDCRHGRVLLREGRRLLVWHPMTGDRHYFQDNGRLSDPQHASAALICQCAADDGGDDLKLGQCTPCHASHFRVAVVSNRTGYLSCDVFSSLTGLWSIPCTLPPTHQMRQEPCVIVGKTLYQPLFDFLVLAFDTDQRTLTTFERPRGGNVRLLNVDDRAIGLAGVLKFTFRLWVRHTDAWVLQKTVDLNEILPCLSTPSTTTTEMDIPPVKIIGVAEGGKEIFIRTTKGIFLLYVDSMELEKVYETTHNVTTLYPYGALYLPPTARTQRLRLSTTVPGMLAFFGT